jgi:capsular exopolysaccharide synthesis family protein
VTDDPQPTPLARYLALGRRRLWIIVAATLLVPAVALAVSLAQQHRYEATSTVLLSRQSVANSLTGVQDPGTNQQSFEQIRTTQAKLARVPRVAAEAIRGAHLATPPTVDRFLDHSSVAAADSDDLLSFHVTDPERAWAIALARSYANAFVAYRQALDNASLDLALRDVRRAQADARAAGGASDQLSSSLATKEQQLLTLRALQSSNARVVSNPQKAEQVAPRPVRNVVLGVLVGLVLGIGLAFLIDLLDTRVRSTEEITAGLGLPLLSSIRTPRRGPDGLTQLVMVDDPAGADAESFRILRTNVGFMNLEREARVIMVSSSTESEGKSTTIANLAVAMARAGERTIVVDLDLRRPILPRLFRFDAPLGLTSVVLGQAALGDAICEVPLDPVGADGQVRGGSGATVSILPTGPLPPDPGEFVGSARLAAVLAELRVRYEWVLVDAPPMLGVSDPRTLSTAVDAIFVCCRLGVLRRPMLRGLHGVLSTCAAPTLGFVVTGADSDETAGYGYGYGYREADARESRPARPRRGSSAGAQHKV